MTDIHASHLTLRIFQAGDIVSGLLYEVQGRGGFWPSVRGYCCTACGMVRRDLREPCDPACSECGSPLSKHAGDSCLFGPTKYKQRVYDIKIERRKT